ncbi:MAG: hypothetical protein M3322_05085 [Actinomycetota bacterium]|nr:hypothetical protein [Actinomycetota bacterium]
MGNEFVKKVRQQRHGSRLDATWPAARQIGTGGSSANLKHGWRTNLKHGWRKYPRGRWVSVRDAG